MKPTITFEGAEVAALGLCLRSVTFEVADKPTESGSVILDALGGDIKEWIAFREKLREVQSDYVIKAAMPMVPTKIDPAALIATPRTVIEATAREFDVDLRLFKSRYREIRTVSNARQVAMYMLREMTRLSLPEIGRYLGGRDHTTVLHGVRQVALKVAADPTVKRQTLRIRQAVEEQLSEELAGA